MTLLWMFLAGWLARSAFVSAGIGNPEETPSWPAASLLAVAFAAALWLGLAR